MAFNSWRFAVVGVIMQGYDSGVRVVTSSTLCVYSEGREDRQAVNDEHTYTLCKECMCSAAQHTEA